MNRRIVQEPSQRPRGNQAGAARSRLTGSGSDLKQQRGTASTITSQIQVALDQQVGRGAKMMTNVAHSVLRAADELETDAPQIAGLVRGMADRVKEYSRNLEKKSVTEIYQGAADFTRRQPAVVFGLAALAGFFALRTLKSSSTRSEPTRAGSQREEIHGS